MFGPYLVQMKVEEDLVMHGSCRGRLVSETARSAHVWGKGWGTALAVLQEGSGEMAENRIAQGRPPGAFRSGSQSQFCLGARGGGGVTYSAAIGRNLVFHWLQPEAVRYFSNEAAGTRITSAYSPR